MTIGVREVFDQIIVAAGHDVSRDNRVLDLALECDCEAMPYSGKAGFELVGVHDPLLCFLYRKLPQCTLIVSQVSRLIWYIDKIELRA
jgi:hypothetical protein